MISPGMNGSPASVTAASRRRPPGKVIRAKAVSSTSIARVR